MRTWIFTSAFCKSKMLEQGLSWMYKESHTPKDINHVIIDQHYPIDKIQNRARIRDLCDYYKCIYVDSGQDLGLHRGLNNAMQVVGVEKDDLVLGKDPDDNPSPGWVDAMRTIHSIHGSNFAVVALNFGVIEMRRREGKLPTEENWGGVRVWIHPSVEMFNVVGIKASFLQEIGGFYQPFNYYGCIEAVMYPKWASRGLRLGYLPDFSAEAKLVDRNDPELLDPELRQYKDAHLGGFTHSFEDWLKLNAPHRL